MQVVRISQPLRQLSGWVGATLFWVCVAVTILAAAAAWLWLGDLVVHFRAQYVAAALVAAALLLLNRQHRLAAAAVVVALVNAYGLFTAIRAPSAMPQGAFVARAAGTQAVPVGRPVNLRAAAVNVFFANDNYAAVIDWVQAERPDVVVFAEVTPDWLLALEALSAEYPQRLTSRSSGRFMTALFSRYPVEESQLLDTANNEDREIATGVRIDGRRVRFVAVHATWPFGPRLAAVRNREIAGLAQYARAQQEPLVMLGDFNISPLSPHFRSGLLERGELRSAAVGFGWQPTWPTFMPLAGIQIDHILVSPEIQVREFRRGPWVGSDHRPVIADLEILPN